MRGSLSFLPMGLLLLSTSCASTRTEDRLQALEKQLAAYRAEVMSLRQEASMLRDKQRNLAAELELKYKEAVKNIMGALLNDYIPPANRTLKQTRPSLYQDSSGEKSPLTPEPQPPPDDTAPMDPAKWVKKVGPNNYQIKQQGLYSVLSDTTLLARSARIVPSVRDGKPYGFKLYAIRPGSFYAVLGLHNGDVVYEINGMECTTPDKVLDVYTKLRNSKTITLSIRRKDQLVKYVYNVIP
jgi:hypothetical protein